MQEPAKHEQASLASGAPPAAQSGSAPRLLLGIAGSIARRHGLDPWLVRLAFILAAVIGGLGLIVYVGLMLGSTGDQCPSAGDASDTTAGLRTGLAVALLMVGLAALPLLDALGVFERVSWPFVGGIVLVGAGAFLVARHRWSPTSPPPNHPDEQES